MTTSPDGLETPVSDYLELTLRERVRQAGLVYWLDRDGLYTGVVDELRSREGDGGFPHPIVAFRGSYLETMFDLERLFDSVDPRPVLLHLPALNEEALRATPLLEFVRAGKRFRTSLETLVTDAATGRIRPDAIAEFLATSPSQLSEADAWFVRELNQPAGGLATQLGLITPSAALEQLLNRGQLLERARHEGDRAELWAWLEVKLGLDPAWRQESGVEDAPEDIAAAVTEWVLCVEYVHDLTEGREPRVERLRRLRSLPAGLAQECSATAAHLRSRHPAHYERLAREVQERLGDEAASASPEDLGRIDTFPFEEDAVLRAAIDALPQDAWAQIRTWASGRLSGGSFWLRDRDRRAAWELLLAAVDLGEAIDAAGPGLGVDHSHEAAMARYTSVGAPVDAAHRRLEQECWARRHAELPHSTALRGGLAFLRQAYREWADRWARDYSRLCESVGFLPPTQLQQRSFFDEVVRPWASESGVVALFLVDALRFEMAAQLAAGLQGQAATDVHLNARLAELPSLTAVGMNALAPVAQGGKLRPILKGSSFGGFRTAEFQVTSPESRHRAMQAGAGGATCPRYTLQEVLGRTPESLRRGIAKADLVVVHSLEIDEAGEKGLGYAVFEGALQSLRAAWKLLRDAGVRKFVITADHGFLLLDEQTGRTTPHGKKTDPKRRHVVYPHAIRPTGQVSVPLADLGYEGVEGHLVLAEDTKIFDIGHTDQTFVHGGNSLQERVIPVLTLHHRKAGGSGTLSYGVTASMQPGIAGMHCVRGTVSVVVQEGLPFGGVQQVELALRAADAEEVLAEVVDVRHATRTPGGLVVEVGVEFEVFFRLTGPTDDRVAVELFHPIGAESVKPGRTVGRFAVAGVVAVGVAASGGGDTEWLDGLADPGVRRLFEHLAAHGSITEAEATKLLGSPRAFRRFSREFEKHAALAPFAVRVEVTAAGKRIVREGGKA